MKNRLSLDSLEPGCSFRSYLAHVSGDLDAMNPSQQLVYAVELALENVEQVYEAHQEIRSSCTCGVCQERGGLRLMLETIQAIVEDRANPKELDGERFPAPIPPKPLPIRKSLARK